MTPRLRPAPRPRRAHEAERPLASALVLGDAHVDVIEQSHARCKTIGLSRHESPDHSPLGRADLAETRERNRRLCLHAAPVMEMLYEQIVNTQSMVVLTDACGTIVHAIGDDDFLARASKVALMPGVNWSESAKGTNAIGTALVRESPTLVHADEHFIRANHFLTCSASPILDPRGNMLGVLDVTGDHRRYHEHTMGLVKMSARMIENHWLSDDFGNLMRLHLHARVECIGTLMEGILAVARDGRVVGANRSALDHLGLSASAVRMHSVNSLFGVSVGTLVDHFRSPLAAPLCLSLPGGKPCHAVARFDWASWYVFADPARRDADPARSDADPARRDADPARSDAAPERRPPPEAATRAQKSEDGLDRLDTGDAQMHALLARLRKLVDRDIPILITGEIGSGKETLARAIHAESARARKPFVVFSGAASGDALADAFVQAGSGSLFLDELADMSPDVQQRLLRALQERRVTPPTSLQPVAVGPAIVSATRHDLSELIAARRFREDLYYRLNVLVVRLPSLRERSDLAALAEAVLRRECAPSGPLLSARALQRLAGYHWPGNLRQLSNALRAAAAMAAGEPAIDCDHLPDELNQIAPSPCRREPAVATLHEAELEMIRHAVSATGGNVSAAARQLGISRNTIYRKLHWNAGAGR